MSPNGTRHAVQGTTSVLRFAIGSLLIRLELTSESLCMQNRVYMTPTSRCAIRFVMICIILAHMTCILLAIGRSNRRSFM